MINKLLEEYNEIEEQRTTLYSYLSSLTDKKWKIAQQLQDYFIKNKLYFPIEKAPEYLDILEDITNVTFVFKDGSIEIVSNDYGIYWDDTCECLDSGVDDYGHSIDYDPNTGLYSGQITTTKDNPIIGFYDIHSDNAVDDTSMIELIRQHLRNKIHGDVK